MTWLFVPLLVLPAAVLLYRAGILSSQAAFSVGGCWGGSTWWRGRYAFLSGSLSRRFSVGRRGTLLIQASAEEGDLDITVEDGDSVLGVWQGAQQLSVQLDVSSLSRCTICLHARKFRGAFFVTLQ